MTSTLIAGLATDLDKRAGAGLERKRRVVDAVRGTALATGDSVLLSFASNDYLGLAAHPALAAAAREAIDVWGVGAGASHLVCGHTTAHEAMEDDLAAFVAPCERARAVSFSSGYLANLAILSTLATRDAVVFADRLNHACLNDGAILSRATLVRYAHGDVDALARRLSSTQARCRVIATDAVFSMDGDVAPLRELLALAERYDAWLVVDDAHGFGVLGGGRGSLAHLGIASERIVYMATLGKAAGVAGAFVAAHPAVVETLVQAARPYIYTTAQPPMLACAVRAALSVIRDDAPRRERLHASIARFREAAHTLRWTLMPSPTAIQPLIVGQADAAMDLSRRLADRGLWVPAIRPPTVPAGTARLRISLSAAHTDEDIDTLLRALVECA